MLLGTVVPQQVPLVKVHVPVHMHYVIFDVLGVEKSRAELTGEDPGSGRPKSTESQQFTIAWKSATELASSM